MKSLLLKIVLFLILAVVIDIPLGYFLSEKVQDYQFDKRIERLLQGDLNYNVIILGSSRAFNDIDAKVLSENMGKEAYNLGFSGANVSFKAYLFKLLEKTGQLPETLLYVMDDRREFMAMKTGKFRYDALRPYSYNPDIFYTLCKGNELKYIAGRLSATYRENSNFSDVLIYLANGKKKPDFNNKMNANGSAQIDSVSATMKTDFDSTDPVYNRKEEVAGFVADFEYVVKSCREQNVKLVLVYPPNYYTPCSGFKLRVSELAGNNVPTAVFDNNRYPVDYYYDNGHLNKTGAEIFSADLAKYLLYPDL